MEDGTLDAESCPELQIKNGKNRKEDEMGTVIKIMVVDDEAGICRNVEKILTKNNYKVTSANSAQEALEIMRNESFNLMITDFTSLSSSCRG